MILSSVGADQETPVFGFGKKTGRRLSPRTDHRIVQQERSGPDAEIGGVREAGKRDDTAPTEGGRSTLSRSANLDGYSIGSCPKCVQIQLKSRSAIEILSRLVRLFKEIFPLTAGPRYGYSKT